MIRRTSLIRPNLRKYKNIFLGIIAFMVISAYPGYLLSEDISAHFVIEHNYKAAEEITVDYNLDLKVYENTTNEKSFSDIVLNYINNAEKEIHVAMYSFNIESLRDALIQAHQRGVNVNLYYPYAKSGQFDEFMGNVNLNFNLNYIGKFEEDDFYYHMHHKFIIVDPGTESQTLLTGPWNWSHYQEDLDPNLLLETHDGEIISAFMNEVKRINRGLSGYFKFRDLTYVPWEKKITYKNGDYIEIWWSPGRKQNSIESRAVDLIKNAEHSIDIGQTLTNSSDIARWLLRKAKEGVPVRLIVNASTRYDEKSNVEWIEGKIQDLELENFQIYDGGTLATVEDPEYSIFHHHNMIIDDKYVFTSTANWSYNGFFTNDENTFVIKSDSVAERFNEIFENYLNYIQKS